ncbi:MAG TPA: sugar ABC transporter substrate-binding protein [Deinococcales bacterium]|nr:sugar ABC transporter substrate-binding protein [Deinococcales bacterium]
MKRFLAALAVLTVGAGLVFAQPDRSDIRIVVVSHGAAADPFWSVAKNGVDQAAEDMGVTVEYHAPETFDMARMSQLIDAAIASNPDGLVVSIPDADALGGVISDAVEAGIPVMSMNSGVDDFEELGVIAHIGQTEYEAGFGAGEQMAEAGITNAVCVNHEVGNTALDLRCEGFQDGLGDGASVDVLAVGTDPTEVRNAVMAAFSGDDSLEGALAVGPVGGEPTIAALEESDLLGEVALGFFDLSPTILETIADGNAMFAIDQQQYLQGYLPVMFLTLYAQYGLLPGDNIVRTGPGFVTPDNAAQVVDLSATGIR